jgi:hypothetical protein
MTGVERRIGSHVLDWIGPTSSRCRAFFLSTVRRPVRAVRDILRLDHGHSVGILPEGHDRSPLRWRRIKEEFTRAWLEGGGVERDQSESRRRHRQRGVWQEAVLRSWRP